MVKFDEAIRAAYEMAARDGKLKGGFVLHVEGEGPVADLAVIPSVMLEGIEARVRDLEQELDDRKTADSIAWFENQGLDDELLSPQDLEAHERADVAVVKSVIAEANFNAAAATAAAIAAQVRRASSTMRQSTGSQPGALRHKRKQLQGF